MTMQDVLDFLGTDVFSTTNNQILFSAGHHDGSFRTDSSHVAGTEVPIRSQRFPRLQAVDITKEHRRPSHEYFALGAQGYGMTFGVGYLNLIIDNLAIRGGSQFALLRTDKTQRNHGRFRT